MKSEKGFMRCTRHWVAQWLHATFVNLLRLTSQFSLLPLIVLFLFYSHSPLASKVASYEYIYIVYAQGDDARQKHYVETIERIKELEPHIRIRLINKRTLSSALQRQLFTDGVECIIGLGEPTLRTLNGMTHKHKFDIVYGFINENPSQHADYFGVSTVPSPKVIFNQLGVIDPSRKKVFVVYLKGRDDELIADAQSAAKLQGISLVSLASDSLSDMAVQFQTAIKNINIKEDALWLLSSTKMDSAITNGILAQAWERQIFVFSSDYRDVNRGVLFSLKPNYTKLGDRLSEQLNSLRFESKKHPYVSATQDVNVVVNSLTAEHLKIKFLDSQLDSYSFISLAADNAK